VWSWATCGFGCTADETINLRIVQTEDDRALVIQALEAVAKSALKRLHKFRPQVIFNVDPLFYFYCGFLRLLYLFIRN
jgi:hypothetical protein